METKNNTNNLLDLSVSLVLRTWATQNKQVNTLLESISEEDLLKETAPGRSTGIYLLGHLAAINDALLPLFGLGQRLYPELENTFVKNPYTSELPKPSVAELKKYWNKINETLTAHFDSMKAEDWFSRHTAVSAEDFVKEPHRNKLNVLINRSVHQGYHIGQLVYLKAK
jgi:hypothetical protein